MPEGHTLHRLARDLQPLVGARVRASSPQGRFEGGAQLIAGRTIEGVDAYGKHLLVDFGAVTLHVHLGLAGSMFRADPSGAARNGVRLRLTTEEPPVAWDLVAPLRCELLDADEVTNLLARLGPDPLRGDAADPFVDRVLGSGRRIGALLLDQSVIAGVGNVFRNEALHVRGIHPDRRGESLSRADVVALWEAIAALMRRAVVEGRIITVDDVAAESRHDIPESEGRYVYKQATCRTCGMPVRTWAVGGRSAYACETCQV